MTTTYTPRLNQGWLFFYCETDRHSQCQGSIHRDALMIHCTCPCHKEVSDGEQRN